MIRILGNRWVTSEYARVFGRKTWFMDVRCVLEKLCERSSHIRGGWKVKSADGLNFTLYNKYIDDIVFPSAAAEHVELLTMFQTSSVLKNESGI